MGLEGEIDIGVAVLGDERANAGRKTQRDPQADQGT